MNLQFLKIAIGFCCVISAFISVNFSSTSVVQVNRDTVIAQKNGITLTYEDVDAYLAQLHEAGEETADLSTEEANYIINNLVEDFLENPEKIILTIYQPNFPAINPVVQAD